MNEGRLHFLDKLTDRVLIDILKIFLAACTFLTMRTARVYTHAKDGSLAVYGDPSSQLSLEEISEDTVSWLRIEDTEIDFPIMQGSDNREYLTKDPYGNYSVSGSVFLDCRNSPDMCDPYSLVYGHHMRGQYMFGTLDLFRSSDYLREHREGTVRAGGQVYRLRIFCCMKTDAYDEEVYDPSLFNKEDFLKYAEAHAYVYEEPEEGRFIVLSTCESDSLTGRTAVIGVLN